MIEILVVCAILLILFSLLSPMFRKALDAAQMMECMNNQKQTSIAAATYLDEYGGSWPWPWKAADTPDMSAGNFYIVSMIWLRELAPLLEVPVAIPQSYSDWYNKVDFLDTLFFCPARTPAQKPIHLNQPQWNVGYGPNFRGLAKGTQKVALWKDPSRKILMADAVGGGGCTQHNLVWPYWTNPGKGIVFPHGARGGLLSGRSNIMFGDFHVEALYLEEGPEPGQDNYWISPNL
ncbi:MAG: hypothetical protein HQL31_09710 [Planctomycetes bacterium]|nr:hypothetical protein [Planctomycetota bacterium]